LVRAGFGKRLGSTMMTPNAELGGTENAPPTPPPPPHFWAAAKFSAPGKNFVRRSCCRGHSINYNSMDWRAAWPKSCSCPEKICERTSNTVGSRGTRSGILSAWGNRLCAQVCTKAYARPPPVCRRPCQTEDSSSSNSGHVPPLPSTRGGRSDHSNLPRKERGGRHAGLKWAAIEVWPSCQ